MIDLQDQGLNGLEGAFPGISTASVEQLDALKKALDAQQLTGRDYNNTAVSSFGPMKVESLDKVLKVVTFQEQQLRMFKRIGFSTASNTVEEYLQQTAYGGDAGSFVGEGELPGSNDPTYVRRAQLVKYLGDTRSVTHVATLVRGAFGTAMDQQVKSGTINVLRALNRGLAFADSAIIPEEFNGFLAQQQSADVFSSLTNYLSSEVVIDLRGGILTEAVVEQAAEAIVENYGVATELFLPPSVHSKFANSLLTSKRYVGGDGVKDLPAGGRVNGFTSQFGDIDLTYDIFLNGRPTKKSTTTATNANAPAAPVADGTTPIAAVAATAANTKWASTDAGTYFYAVSAVNRFGESALTVMSNTITTIATGGAVDLKFTAGSGTFAASGYVIYRSDKAAASVAAATFYPVFAISTAQLTAGYDGAAAGLVRDLNRFMPGMKQAFLLQNNDEVVTIRQLAPLMKMDLATIAPAFRFMVLMYATPILFAPKKMARFINVGAY